MPESLIALESGLDLRSASINAPKGSLSNCFNMEKDQAPGLVRRRGWVRYDGRVCGPEVDDAIIVIFRAGELTGFPEYGEQVEINGPGGVPAQYAICLGCALGAPMGATLILAYPTQSFTNWTDITAFNAPGTSFVGQSSGFFINQADAIKLMNDATITVPEYNFCKGIIKSLHSEAVGAVPGRPESPVDAAFTYGDFSYAIHDCVAFDFMQGTQNGSAGIVVPAEGHCVRDQASGAFLGRILSVEVSGGSWDTNAVGTIVLYDVPLGVAMPAFNGRLDLYDAQNSVLLSNFARYNALSSPNNTRALLYQTYEQYVKTYAFGSTYGVNAIEPPWFAPPSPPTWSRPRLTRELPYKMDSSSAGFGPIGTQPYSVYEYSRLGLSPDLAALQPQNTGEKFPTVATDVSGVVRWVNPNNILVQDTAVANYINISGNVGFRTAKLNGTGFDFSSIPDGSVIIGVVFRMRAACPVSVGDYFVADVRLTSAAFPNGYGATNKAVNYLLPMVLTDYTFGAAEDLWGEQLTTAIIKDPSFGVSVQFQKSNNAAARTVNVDCYAMTVYYAPPSRAVYIRDQTITGAPSKDILANVIHYCIDSGDFTTQTAAGVLTVWIGNTEAEGTAAGKIRRVAAGNEIRTAPSNPITNAPGGSLLALVTAEDYPTSYPPSAALDAASSRYEVIDANFWDVPEGRAAYVVNGAEYATMFDGTFHVRIRTGQPAINDCPRHVAAHLGYLHLGFASGAVINTATGRPLTTLGYIGTSVVNFGEPVTGLLTLNGSTLGVWTDRSTRGLQGTSPASNGGYTPTMISPAINCIEYTLVNLVGQAVWASFRGVETIRTVQAYGDFETLPLSAAAQQWLQGRLQVDLRIGAIPSRPVYAIGVRNSRQYRLFCGDGYVYTLTLFDAGDLPVSTIQRLTRPNRTISNTGFNMEPWDAGVIRHVSNGTRSDGKELILAAFENQNAAVLPAAGGSDLGPYFPYVVRLDCGYTDDAATHMEAWCELNAIYGSYPTQNVKWGSGTVFANCYGGSQIKVYTKTDYDGPIYDSAYINYARSNAFGVPVGVREQTLQIPLVETRAFIPVPQRYTIFDISAEGRMLKLRIDVTQSGGSTPATVPLRLTHVSLTTETQLLDRS